MGKTSLVRRYVDSVFSEKYTTTIGVKIDKKKITLPQGDLSMVLWDVYGEDNHQSVMPAYLRGMSGYLLVIDPTRPNTFESAISLQALVKDTLGLKPFVLVKNKADLRSEWQNNFDGLEQLESDAVAVMETSAKLDTGVDEMFSRLATALLAGDHKYPVILENLPVEASRYIKTVLFPMREFGYLQLNEQNCVISSGGDLQQCGVPELDENRSIEHQIDPLSGLLPVTGEPLVILNTQLRDHVFIDIHIVNYDDCQWVFFINNTEAGIKLQAEQQTRLSDDIVQELRTKT